MLESESLISNAASDCFLEFRRSVVVDLRAVVDCFAGNTERSTSFVAGLAFLRVR